MGIKMLGKEVTAKKGNFISAIGMFLAIIVTAIEVVNPLIVLAAYWALIVQLLLSK